MATANDTRYDPRKGPRDRRLRVGDAEREAVAEILRRGHVDGRLDPSEFQERLERCLTAKTYAELDALVSDFPRDDVDERRRVRRAWGRRPWPLPLLPLFLLAVAVFVSHGHVLWLALPLLFFFLVRRSWSRGF
jgi:hypothetical protein